MSRVLGQLHEELDTAGLVHKVSAHGACDFFGVQQFDDHYQPFDEGNLAIANVSYVDDVVIPVFASAPHIFDSVLQCVLIAIAVFWKFCKIFPCFRP